jgi:uncharacterized protein (TIGR00255 family)
MTAYASAQQELAAGGTNTPSNTPSNSPSNTSATPIKALQLGLEIRSVNSRFLDLTFKLPEDLRTFEPALRELITSQLKRGKVEVRGSIERAHASDIPEPSVKQLQRLSSIQDSVTAWLPKAAPLSVADVIRLASAEATQNNASALPAHAETAKPVLALAKKVLKDLLSARAREGARLTEMLVDRLVKLRELAAQAEPLVPQLVAQQQQKFLTKWHEALNMANGTLEAAQDRAFTEATAFAIRIDVAEEISRLNSHLDELQSLLQTGGELGKRLDFLIQELHREANTLGSKSPALELTRISVDMKVLIEQMREQVQNIE